MVLRYERKMGHRGQLPRDMPCKASGEKGGKTGVRAGKVNRAKVLDALSKDQYAIPKEIAEIVGLTADTVNGHLRILCRSGKAERTSMGYRRAA